jgi:hypothetical protein
MTCTAGDKYLKKYFYLKNNKTVTDDIYVIHVTENLVGWRVRCGFETKRPNTIFIQRSHIKTLFCFVFLVVLNEIG